MAMKHLLLMISSGLVFGLGVLLFFGYRMMTGPLYTPGNMGEEASLIHAAHIEDDYIRLADGAKLGYRATGSGKPVLMLHGGPGFPFTEEWKALEGISDYRFIYYDQRGCGRSDRPFTAFNRKNFYENMKILEGTLGIAAQIRDIEEIRKGLGVEKLILVGHSFGGFLGALYAAEFPDHVDRLILVAPAAVMRMPEKEGNLFTQVERRLTNPTEAAEFKAYMKDYFDFQSVFNKTEAELSNLNARFSEFFVKAAREDGASATEASARSAESYEQGAIGGFMTWALYFSMGSRHDYRAALRKIRAPTLIITGTNDMAGMEPVIRRQYGDFLSTCKIITIKGSGHFPFEEKPDEFGRIFSDFLKE